MEMFSQIMRMTTDPAAPNSPEGLSSLTTRAIRFLPTLKSAAVIPAPSHTSGHSTNASVPDARELATEGWLNLVLSGMLKTDPAEERHMLERALLRVRTLRGMVNELISLTAIQTGNFSLKRAPVVVAEIVAEVVAAGREKADERRISVEVSDGAAGTQVLADRDALSMICSNLVENAAHREHEGTVSVTSQFGAGSEFTERLPRIQPPG